MTATDYRVTAPSGPRWKLAAASRARHESISSRTAATAGSARKTATATRGPGGTANADAANPPEGGHHAPNGVGLRLDSAFHRMKMPMLLHLLRDPSHHHVTFGTLFVDEVMECLTLDDEIRERPGVPVSAWKVPGQTATPAGRYSMSLTMSARFGCVLPLLRDVPGFSGIRIHTGTVIDDTDGCILVGRRVSGMKIAESRIAFRKLMAALERADASGNVLAIDIRNP